MTQPRMLRACKTGIFSSLMYVSVSGHRRMKSPHGRFKLDRVLFSMSKFPRANLSRSFDSPRARKFTQYVMCAREAWVEIDIKRISSRTTQFHYYSVYAARHFSWERDGISNEERSRVCDSPCRKNKKFFSYEASL